MRPLLTASKQQLLKQQLEHTFIPNTSPKQETATSTLKHELLYYLSTSSITARVLWRIFGGRKRKWVHDNNRWQKPGDFLNLFKELLGDVHRFVSVCIAKIQESTLFRPAYCFDFRCNFRPAGVSDENISRKLASFASCSCQLHLTEWVSV